MNLNNLLEAAAAQDAMFWVAATSVALGLTLIVVAAFAQTRRLKRRVTVAAAAQPTMPPASPANPPATAQHGPSRSADVPDGVTTDQLRHLLARVRDLAAAVEALQPSAHSPLFEPDESLLKESTGDVEYIYRAETG